MEFKKAKLLQKNEGRKRGKYEITLEVTDYDIEMLEDLAKVDLRALKKETPNQYRKLMKWTDNSLFYTFHKLWRKYG